MFLIAKTADAQDLPWPAYMTEGASGLDLFAHVQEAICIQKGAIQFVPTGIRIALPPGYEAQIRPRSGLALRNGISLLNTPGTVDSDYRGEIGLILINHGSEDFWVTRGLRIAQMVIHKVEQISFTPVEEEALDETDRGNGGFGHTGCGRCHG